MKRALAFIIPFFVVFGIGLAIFMMTRDTGIPRGEPVAMDIGDVHLEQPFVRLQGMAHYPVVVRQTVPGNLLVEPKTLYLFPLFAEHETGDRAIRVLVRTERAPEAMVAYEYMVVEGHLSMPTPDKVPYSTEISLGKRSDYFFTDEMLVLEPWRIEADGEVWELAEE